MPARETPAADAIAREAAGTVAHAEPAAADQHPPRGELFRALYGTLGRADQQWVSSKIRHYLRTNAEQHVEARL
jgi:hypothetical protein